MTSSFVSSTQIFIARDDDIVEVELPFGGKGYLNPDSVKWIPGTEVDTPFGPGVVEDGPRDGDEIVKVKFEWSTAYLNPSTVSRRVPRMLCGGRRTCPQCGHSYNAGTNLALYGCDCIKAKIAQARQEVADMNDRDNIKPVVLPGGKRQCTTCGEEYQAEDNLATSGCKCIKGKIEEARLEAERAKIVRPHQAYSPPKEEEKTAENKTKKPEPEREPAVADASSVWSYLLPVAAVAILGVGAFLFYKNRKPR